MKTAHQPGSACCRRLPPIRLAMGMMLLLAVASARGETLFKCRAADGVTSYQSAPCAPTHQQVWRREVTPEPVPRVATQHPQTQRSAIARSKVVRTRAASASVTRANACARARAAADEERDRRWYTITFDRLRELDDLVARACK